MGITLQHEDVIYIAEVCHEANRVVQRHNDEPVNPAWHETSQELRDSAVDGVFHLVSNPEATPEQSHENWLRFKEAEGWTYGEVKDFEAKTHPCFVSYDQLPAEQRIKDSLFHAIVHAMAGSRL